jgi:polyisoprenoid-binding protein YceI
MLRGRMLAALLAPVGVALATAAWTPATPGSTDSAARAALAAEGAPAFRLVVAPANNRARYLIQERLAGMDLPYDAVGETSGIGGEIMFDDRAQVIAEQSLIVVDVSRLTSDKERRDKYVQARLLTTADHPTVDLVPTAVRGLTGPLPTSGARNFQLIGDLTVRGVTRPTLWKVAARFQGGKVSGTASTAFTFDDFKLTQPRVPFVLSLADTIRLEYDFEMNREALGGTTAE